MELPESPKNQGSRIGLIIKMLSNSDHQLLVSIVQYLQSIEGDATNANLVKEALRLIQSLFVLLLMHRLSFGLDTNITESTPNIREVFEEVEVDDIHY